MNINVTISLISRILRRRNQGVLLYLSPNYNWSIDNGHKKNQISLNFSISQR